MTLADKLHNRATRVRLHRWRNRPWHSTEPHIVIGGTPRSGTTLLRRILDRHPAICCGPESSILLPGALRLGPVAAGFGLSEDELVELVSRDSMIGVIKVAATAGGPA